MTNNEGKDKEIVISNSWTELQQYTTARIALGRTGVSLPVREQLQFKMAHAHARDAVFSLLDKDILFTELQRLQLPVLLLKSKAADKQMYLQRPDLGRRLHEQSVQELESFPLTEYDVCISITDGLSAAAVNHHATPLINVLVPMLLEQKLRLAPLCLIAGGRVAISDEIGSLLKTKLSLILIGERPGLSSPDSLGAYLTYTPKIGLTDESRNCISNIRPEGLKYEDAADKIFYLIKEAFRLQLSGVLLKDNSDVVSQVSV